MFFTYRIDSVETRKEEQKNNPFLSAPVTDTASNFGTEVMSGAYNLLFRYCSREHQTIDWSASHKRECCKQSSANDSAITDNGEK